MPVLDRYFEAMRSHDWEGLSACLAKDVHRTGPYLDVIEGRDAYTKFLSDVIPAPENYSLVVRKTHELAQGSAMVELSEHLDMAGVSTETPEVIVFDFNDEGLIARVDIYIKQRPPAKH